jgi:hypothetical protein
MLLGMLYWSRRCGSGPTNLKQEGYVMLDITGGNSQPHGPKHLLSAPNLQDVMNPIFQGRISIIRNTLKVVSCVGSYIHQEEINGETDIL